MSGHVITMIEMVEYLNNKKYLNLDEEQFRKDCGIYSYDELVKKYDVSSNTITNWKRRFDINKTKPRPHFRKKIPDKHIFEKDCMEMQISDLCEKYETNNKIIMKWKKFFGIDYCKPDDYLALDVEQFKKNVKIMCVGDVAKKYGRSPAVINRWIKFHNVGFFCKRKHVWMSYNEKEIHELLEQWGIVSRNTKWKYNDKVYEIDCYISSKNIGIEYCGEYWHSDKYKDKLYHQDKWKWCKDQGIQLITIFEHEWMNKRELVESMIKNRLGLCENRIFARKCQLKLLDTKQSRVFHDQNHIDGFIGSRVNIGLWYGEIPVSVMSFGKQKFRRKVKYDWELNRFSTLRNHVVVGGASKLFNWFLKEHNPESILSYADLQYGEGKVYENLEFNEEGIITPGYHYWKNGQNWSRQHFQRHKMHKYFDDVVEEDTERSIMDRHGYSRIYDCGNMKWVWQRKGIGLLAKENNVSNSCVSHIKHGRTWKHI